jgi:hypothetical protein
MKQWQLSNQNLPNLLTYLENLLKEGKHPVITVKERVSAETTRTIQQNRYLWGHLYKSISSYTGYQPLEIHMLCGWMFLREQKQIGDKQIEFIKSTTDLSVDSMRSYTESIINYFTELGWSDDGTDFS